MSDQVIVSEDQITIVTVGEQGPPAPAAAPATSSALGTLILDGDLSGTANSPTVPGLAANATAISAETTRAEAAEEVLTSGLAVRATITSLTTETTRAETAEEPLAPLASPVLTGLPRAPTAAFGTSTTQLATTGFVAAAPPTTATLLTSGIEKQIVYHAMDYGAVGDGVQILDGVISSSSLEVVNSPSGGFANARAGMTIMIQGAGTSGATLVTTITTSSPTNAKLSSSALTAVSAANVKYGTNNNAALAALVNATNAAVVAGNSHAALFIPPGMYIQTTRLPSPLSGTAWSGVPYGTVIVGGGSTDYAFATGYGWNGSTNPVTNFYMEGITFDSNFLPSASGLQSYYMTDSTFHKVRSLNTAPGGWNWTIGVNNAGTDTFVNEGIKLIECDIDGHSGSLEALLFFNTKGMILGKCKFSNTTGTGPCVGLWQQCSNTRFIHCRWKNNGGSGVYYSYSCADITWDSPHFDNSGGIAGANTSDYGAFGYTSVNGVTILNPVTLGGSNTAGSVAIELGCVTNTIIAFPHIESYDRRSDLLSSGKRFVRHRCDGSLCKLNSRSH